MRLTLMLVVAAIGGCAYNKAVDTTAALQAIAAADSPSVTTYTLLPENILPPGHPLAGKVLAFPSVPGKDATLEVYYPDGQIAARAATKRSAVVDAIAGAAVGIDLGKAAEAAQERAWITSEREAWMAEFRPFIQAGMARLVAPSPPSSGDGGKLLRALRALRDMPGLSTDAKAAIDAILSQVE